MILLRNIVKYFNRLFYTFFRLQQNIDDLKVLNGKILAYENIKNIQSCIDNIQNAEFKVFSQWGDDGIIQFLVSYLEISNKKFIEFGVQDYTESNTRFLLINNNWRGLVMDGSKNNIKYIINDNIYWRYELIAKHIFVTKDNINQIISDNGFSGDIGLLHIDIDGNDYWIWNEINVVNPVIVIIEFNSVFGKEKAITVPYNPFFVRSKMHYSDLYFGASLKALDLLAKSKGYCLIGCNSSGNNAYFVRNDKLKGLKMLSIEESFVSSTFRESRNQYRKLSFISGEKRKDILKGLKVYNVETSQEEILI